VRGECKNAYNRDGYQILEPINTPTVEKGVNDYHYITKLTLIYLIFQIPSGILDKGNCQSFLLNGLTAQLTAEDSHTSILLTRSDS